MKRLLTDTFIRNHPAPEKRLEIYDSKIDGLAIRITETGKKAFVFRYYYNGKNKRITIGSFPAVNLAKARDEASDLSYDVRHGTDPLAERAKARHSPALFSELATDFIKRHLPKLRKRTRDEYKRVIDQELLPNFKNIPASELSRGQIIRVLDSIAIDRKSPTFANRVRATLSSIYSFGVDRAMVEINPVLHIKRIKGENKRDRVYSEDEIRALWKAFEEQAEPVQSLFKMLLICGQRSAETRGMRWTDINDAIWSIPKELTKAGRPHYVPLPEMATEILESLWQLTGKKEHVFASDRTDGPIQWINKAKDRIRKCKGVPEDFRPHDLRRTAASFMAGLGVDRTILGKVLNHKGMAGDHSVTAIYDRYEYQQEKKQALERWSHALNQILTREKGEAKIFKIG